MTKLPFIDFLKNHSDYTSDRINKNSIDVFLKNSWGLQTKINLPSSAYYWRDANGTLAIRVCFH